MFQRSAFFHQDERGQTWLEFPSEKADIYKLGTQLMMLFFSYLYFVDALRYLAWLTHIHFGFQYVIKVTGNPEGVAHGSVFLLSTVILAPVLTISLLWNFFGHEKMFLGPKFVLKSYIGFLPFSKRVFYPEEIREIVLNEIGNGIVIRSGNRPALFAKGLKKEAAQEAVEILREKLNSK